MSYDIYIGEPHIEYYPEDGYMKISVEHVSLETTPDFLELETGFKAGQLVENAKGERGILAFPSLGDFIDWYWYKLKKNGDPRVDKSWISGKFKVVE